MQRREAAEAEHWQLIMFLVDLSSTAFFPVHPSAHVSTTTRWCTLNASSIRVHSPVMRKRKSYRKRQLAKVNNSQLPKFTRGKSR
jgi:hypothetical protein